MQLGTRQPQAYDLRNPKGENRARSPSDFKRGWKVMDQQPRLQTLFGGHFVKFWCESVPPNLEQPVDHVLLLSDFPPMTLHNPTSPHTMQSGNQSPET